MKLRERKKEREEGRKREKERGKEEEERKEEEGREEGRTLETPHQDLSRGEQSHDSHDLSSYS